MSQGIKVLSNDLRKGMQYRVTYTGPSGMLGRRLDFSQIGDKVLKYKHHVRVSDRPYMRTALQFLNDRDPPLRHFIPTSTDEGPIDVDSIWSFTQVYEGPMASGYGPNSGGRRTRRRRASRKTRKHRRRHGKN